MRKIALDHLTVLGPGHADLVTIAADCGYDAISPIGRIHPSMPIFEIAPLTRDAQATRDVQARMRDTGVTIHNMDGFPVMADNDWDWILENLDVAAMLGAVNIATLIFDMEPARAMDSFNRLASEAKARGLGMVIEFTPSSQLERIADADDWIRRSDAPHARILLDTFHLNRSGGSPAHIDAVGVDRIGYIQLSDSPQHGSPKELARRAMHERELPGEGELPLVEILRRVPADVMIGLEIPGRTDTENGMSAYERARRAIRATRALLEVLDG